MGDKSFLIGLGGLLNQDLIRKDVDVSEIEEVLTGLAGNIGSTDPVEQFSDEMKRFEQELGLSEPEIKAPILAPQDSYIQPSIKFSSPYETEEAEPPRAFVGGIERIPAAMPTLERARYDHIESVTQDLFPSRDMSGLSFDEDRREDDRVFMIEEINILTQDLIEMGVDVRPYAITEDMNSDQLKRIYSRIKWRSSTEYYSSYSGEILMFGAKMIEKIFDGEREWFGKFKPNLTGWSNTLHPRIRRLRPQTSRFMGNIISKHDTGFALDLAMEFLPSMFLHNDMRQNQQKEKSLTASDVNRVNSKLRDA